MQEASSRSALVIPFVIAISRSEWMLAGAIFSIYRRRVPSLQFICAIPLLLSAYSMTFAEIPLPRPRPADIPDDQSRQSTAQPSQCQQQLAGIAEFEAMPPITGPGECVANDVVALDSVLLPDKHRVVVSPSAVLRCPMAATVTHWLRDDVAPIIARLGTRSARSKHWIRSCAAGAITPVRARSASTAAPTHSTCAR
jgi:hypothetical protein